MGLVVRLVPVEELMHDPLAPYRPAWSRSVASWAASHRLDLYNAVPHMPGCPGRSCVVWGVGFPVLTVFSGCTNTDAPLPVALRAGAWLQGDWQGVHAALEGYLPQASVRIPVPAATRDATERALERWAAAFWEGYFLHGVGTWSRGLTRVLACLRAASFGGTVDADAFPVSLDPTTPITPHDASAWERRMVLAAQTLANAATPPPVPPRPSGAESRTGRRASPRSR